VIFIKNKNVLILADTSGYSTNYPFFNTVYKTYVDVNAALMLVPTIKKLIKNGNEVTVVSSDNNVQKKLEKEHILYTTYNDYIIDEKFENVWEDALVLAKKTPDIKGKVFREMVTYQDVCLWDLMEGYLLGLYAFAVKNLKIVRCVTDKVKPDAILVLDNKNRLGKIAVTVGSTDKIPTLSIQPRFFSNLKYYILKCLKEIRGEYWDRLYDIPIWKQYFKFCKTKKEVISAKNRILLITNDERALSFSNPWFMELKKDRGNEIIVIGVTEKWQKEYQKAGIHYMSLDDYVTKEVCKRVSAESRIFLKKWDYLKTDESFKKSLAYQGLPLLSIMKDSFDYCFSKVFTQLITLIEIIQHIIKTERPDIIIVLDDRGRFGRTVTRIGSLKNIPTLILQHGAVADHPLFGPIFADKMAVFGERSKKVLVKRGVEPEKLVGTGQPRFDKLVGKDFAGKKEIYHQLNINDDKGLVVLTTQLDDSEGEAVFRNVADAMKKFPEKHLIVKVHPGGSIDFYQRIANEMGINNVVITKNIDLYGLLNACDVMLTSFSTTGLEAMILGKPVITINLTGIPDIVPYAESGAAIGVCKPEELASAINSALYDEKTRKSLEEMRKKFVYESAYKMDGKASERVAGLIEEMINEARKNKQK